jgi:hypothetical protein
MKTTPRQIAVHIVILVVLVVVGSAVSISLGTGPVALSPDHCQYLKLVDLKSLRG